MDFEPPQDWTPQGNPFGLPEPDPKLAIIAERIRVALNNVPSEEPDLQDGEVQLAAVYLPDGSGGVHIPSAEDTFPNLSLAFPRRIVTNSLDELMLFFNNHGLPVYNLNYEDPSKPEITGIGLRSSTKLLDELTGSPEFPQELRKLAEKREEMQASLAGLLSLSTGTQISPDEIEVIPEIIDDEERSQSIIEINLPRFVSHPAAAILVQILIKQGIQAGYTPYGKTIPNAQNSINIYSRFDDANATIVGDKDLAEKYVHALENDSLFLPIVVSRDPEKVELYIYGPDEVRTALVNGMTEPLESLLPKVVPSDDRTTIVELTGNGALQAAMEFCESAIDIHRKGKLAMEVAEIILEIANARLGENDSRLTAEDISAEEGVGLFFQFADDAGDPQFTLGDRPVDAPEEQGVLTRIDFSSRVPNEVAIGILSFFMSIGAPSHYQRNDDNSQSVFIPLPVESIKDIISTPEVQGDIAGRADSFREEGFKVKAGAAMKTIATMAMSILPEFMRNALHALAQRFRKPNDPDTPER